MSSSSSQQDPALMSLEDYVDSLAIDYEEIESDTKKFANENLMSFFIYHPSGDSIKIVARKGLDPKVMLNEIMMSKNLKHKNIVSIFKLALNREKEVFIINKHEANGCLDKHLSGSTLTWIQRLHICVRVADALHYIHNIEDNESVIHGNIKSSHILLDHNWEPKLKGFGFAIRVKKHHIHPTSEYKGSIVYMDPEYERTGGLTHKSDVFSFGVVLFEVLFGIKADGENWYFARSASSHFEASTLDELINADLRKQMDEHSLKIFSETAYICLKEGRAQRPYMDQIVRKLQEALELQQIHEDYLRLSIHLKEKNIDHLRIPLSDIKSATNNFSTNHIGSGGYGTVYKAELDIFDDTISSVPEGKYKADFPKKRRTVAVKRLERKQGEVAHFFKEIEKLTNCKHQNIVSLLGFCEEGHERILVYEHVSNGSLSDYFEKIGNTKRLSWAQRLQICLDIAHGLDYLHSNTEEKPMIIHRDIKSDNILLDNNWVAKISDFGLSRLRPANQEANTINTGIIAGTQVYLDPEYMKTGRLKKESDIYSFGIVLFEVVSGKLAYDNSYSIKNEKGLLSIVQKCFNERTLRNVIDPNLKEASEGILSLDDVLDQKSLDTFFDIAYQCLAHTGARRPTMKVIINELENAAINYYENRKDAFHISLKDITLATKNFSDDTCIREGRYWKQYEGEIPLANRLTTVIVKRWDKNSSQACHQFLTELKVVFDRKHENIVALIGLCNESSERIIVYEYATNGSLDKHLDNVNLTWTKRLKICVGIASGLKFLHEDAGMIHRDIKSSSILLDSDWEPKICNFELSSNRMERLKVEHATDNAYDSLGYLDPLHKEQGYLDERSDAYAFGVILMEILCGRSAWGEECKDHSKSLGPLTKRQFKKGKLDELVFDGIKKQLLSLSFTTFASIAAQCLEERNKRPEASDVVIRLKKALELQDLPSMVSIKLKIPKSKNSHMDAQEIENQVVKRLEKALYNQTHGAASTIARKKQKLEDFRIPLKDIHLAIGVKGQETRIGDGGFGFVYKGQLSEHWQNRTVAIKCLRPDSYQGEYEFRNELNMIFSFSHENIIPFIGYCDEGKEKIIVYEYATNGSLDCHLKDKDKRRFLTWEHRLKICLGAARGLDYLHSGLGEDRVIHRDIKSANILLDHNLVAKVSDFGLSKSSRTNQPHSQVYTNAAGTNFYMDPIYHESGILRKESDVYSFGVVMFELLSGMLAYNKRRLEGGKPTLLINNVRRYYDNRPDLLIDHLIRDEIDSHSFNTFREVAFQCISINSKERPTMETIVDRIEEALELQVTNQGDLKQKVTES